MKFVVASIVAGFTALFMATPSLAQVTTPPTDGVIIRCPAELQVGQDAVRDGLPEEWIINPAGRLTYKLSRAVVERSLSETASGKQMALIGPTTLQCRYTPHGLFGNVPDEFVAYITRPLPAGMLCSVSAQGRGFDCVPFNSAEAQRLRVKR